MSSVSKTEQNLDQNRWIGREASLPIYHYAALSDRGVLTKGEKAAASVQELRDELVAQGLFVQNIRENRSGLTYFRRGRIGPEQFLLFNQELTALIRAGLTIPDALVLAADRPDNPALGRILQRVLEDVRAGMPFSDACAHHPDVFEGLYVSALRTGEKTGDLVKVLARYQDYLRHRVALRKKISQALAYPVFLLIALAVILAVLFVFVLPRFVVMYADFGAELPWATRILVTFVDRFVVIGPALALGAGGAWFAWRRWTGTERGRLAVDGIKERLPYLGPLNRIVATAQLTRSLSTLLGGGTPLVQAMRTTREGLNNRLYAARLDVATQKVTEGESLARAARAVRLLPDTAIKMIEVGEASGGLETMLAEVAQFYEEVLDSRLARVMALIEPVLMLLMGLLIGTIIIIMYLPIFRMADVIK